uniref:DNA-directed RNA polymerase omega chain n=1 Tax=Cyanidium sp. THAL103 TaxID=3027999 RepID=A0A9Y1MYA3_9RHOD|nr:DNA-directed RNA polymerase omega chain [Cyanidium sp. THAL103]
MKKTNFSSYQILCKTEKLVNRYPNKYKICLKISNRAKKKQFENNNKIDKPIILTIIEMEAEISQTQIIKEG